MPHPVVKDTVLCLRDGVSLSLGPDGTDVLEVRGGDAPLRLTPEQLAAVEAFALPRTLESGVRAVARRIRAEGPADALAAVVHLLESGVLRTFVAAGAPPPPPRKLNRAGFFGSPTATLHEALSDSSVAAVFAGAPYDLGVTGRSGTRGGPSYLRTCSRVAFDYEERNGSALGWWHPGRGSRVLAGTIFRDIGDFSADTTRNGVMFDRLYETALSLFQSGRFPVVVGGDHSISLPLITAAAKSHPGLGILQFDAHGDIGASEDMGNWRTNCSHGNFISWVASNPDVASIHQFGIRHLLPERPFAPAKVKTFTGRTFAASFEQILDELPADRPYYVTFDVDCLDPSLISQTGTPIPGGLSYEELSRCFTALGAKRRIIGADVTELTPPTIPTDYREGTLVAYLVFELLAGIFAGRGKRAG